MLNWLNYMIIFKHEASERIKLVFHHATFIARSDFSFSLTSSRLEWIKNLFNFDHNRISRRATFVSMWKTTLSRAWVAQSLEIDNTSSILLVGVLTLNHLHFLLSLKKAGGCFFQAIFSYEWRFWLDGILAVEFEFTVSWRLRLSLESG